MKNNLIRQNTLFSAPPVRSKILPSGLHLSALPKVVQAAALLPAAKNQSPKVLLDQDVSSQARPPPNWNLHTEMNRLLPEYPVVISGGGNGPLTLA